MRNARYPAKPGLNKRAGLLVAEYTCHQQAVAVVYDLASISVESKPSCSFSNSPVALV
jgi:hypothetical protein